MPPLTDLIPLFIVGAAYFIILIIADRRKQKTE